MDPLMSRGTLLFVVALLLGAASVGVAVLSMRVQSVRFPGYRSTRMLAGFAVNALLAIIAAGLWQHRTPIMFEHAFGANNFQLLDSATGIYLSVMMTSFGVFAAYLLGLVLAFAGTSRKTMSFALLPILGFAAGFLASWWHMTERVPFGYQSTVEVRLWYSNDDPSWQRDIGEFYGWAGLQACPYANYDAVSVFHGDFTYANKFGATKTPCVTIRKFYRRLDNPDVHLGVTISTTLAGNFTSGDIDEAVRCISDARSTLPSNGKE